VTLITDMRWWHVYAGYTEHGNWVILTDGPKDHPVPADDHMVGIPWVRTMAQPPDDTDLAHHMPPEYQQ
jgi:hypothetical protein